MLIDYAAAEGRPLRGAVILPPDYRQGRLYPVITWVYGGYVVRDLNDYFLIHTCLGSTTFSSTQRTAMSS